MEVENYIPSEVSPADRRFKGNELIVKDVGFMQAAYSLDISELRLVALAILVLRQDSDRAEFDATVPVTIHANLYADLFGTSRQNAYNMLDQAAKSLEVRQIHWVDTYEDKKRNKKAARFNNLDWTSQCSYVPEMGIVQLCFTPQIIPFLVHVDSTFAGYEIRNLVKLTTPYEFRLYELGVAWKKTGVATFKRETLRYRLGIMSDEQFKTASNFNKMLNKSLDTINRETDLNIEISPNYERNAVAKGRKIKDYTMSVSVKDQFLIENSATLLGKPKRKPAPKKPAKALPGDAGDDLSEDELNNLGSSGTEGLRFSKDAPGKQESLFKEGETIQEGEAIQEVKAGHKRYGIVKVNHTYQAWPNENGTWDCEGILKLLDKPAFSIIGMDVNNIPQELIEGTSAYAKALPRSKVLAETSSKLVIANKITKSRSTIKNEAGHSSDESQRVKPTHNYTHLTDRQISEVMNNTEFRAKYSPAGVSLYIEVNAKLKELLNGDLSMIPDLDQYL